MAYGMENYGPLERGLATALRERDRRHAGVLRGEYDPFASAQADYAGFGWDALFGAEREKAAAAEAAGMNYRSNLSSIGNPGGGMRRRASGSLAMDEEMSPFDREMYRNIATNEYSNATAMEGRLRDLALSDINEQQQQDRIGRLKQAETEQAVNEAFSDPRATRDSIMQRLPPQLRPVFAKQWADQDLAAGKLELEARKLQRDDSPLVAVLGPDGKSILVPRQQAVGMRPASGREQGRPVSSKDAGDIADINTSLDELGRVRGAVKDPGTITKIQSWMPTFVSEMTGGWTDDANEQNAVISRVRQVIGKAMEGGVLRKEDEIKYRAILPVLGDSKAVLESKIDGVQAMLLGKMNDQLNALEDAGYEVGAFRNRGPNQGRGGPAADPRFATPVEGAKKGIPGIEGGLAEFRNGRWVRVQ